MHTSRTTLALTASLFVAGLAACSTAPGETESPPAETTAPADPFHIDQPKNLKAINDPCQLLTPEQLQEIGASNPETSQSNWGEEQCRWTNDLFTVLVAPDTTQRLGLEFPAKRSGKDNPTNEIKGYPALHHGKTEGGCGTYVGTSKEELVFVDFHKFKGVENNPEFADTCAVSDKIAGMVVSNLPPA